MRKKVGDLSTPTEFNSVYGRDDKHRFWVWWEKHWVMVVLGLVLVLGAFLRLYRIEETLMFQGDQGRDAVVVKRMIKDFDLTLLGPVTSVGNMYLGPFYYYFMAPFLWLTYPNPVGPAYGVALVNIVTIGLIFVAGKQMVGRRAALIASLLFAGSAVGIEYSRFSWNPNIAPIFSLLIIWGLYNLKRAYELKWYVLVLVSMGILAQLHYVALLMAPVIGLSVIYILWQKRERGFSAKVIGLSVVAVMLVIMPLVLFDLRHNLIISNSFKQYLEVERGIEAPRSWEIFSSDFMSRLSLLFSRMLTSSSLGNWDRIIAMLGVGLLVGFGIREKSISRRWVVGLMLLTLGVSVLGLSLVTTSIYHHYVLYFLPVVCLAYGWVLVELYKMSLLTRVLSVLGLVGILWLNVGQYEKILTPSTTPYSYYQEVSRRILPYTSQGKYNVASISSNRDFLAMPFRYFLETSDNPPAHHDEIFDLDQLILIDEESTDNPLSHPAAIIAHPAAYLEGIVRVIEISDEVSVYVVE